MVTLMEGEWSCYRDDHFNGGKMVRLQSWPVYLKGEWSCYRGSQLNGGRIVILQRWPV